MEEYYQILGGLKIYDISGREVNLNNIKPGIYIIFDNEEGIYEKIFISEQN